jgi:F0F1-type ATP synthase membrane subunit c/vacuolar-type H+-ATPase subunit K
MEFMAMRFPALVVAATLTGLFAGIGDGLAQQAGMGCRAEQPPGKPQTLRCGGGLTIIAENGADFTLLDRDHDGRINGIDLRSKAVFIDAPKKKSGRQFEVTTPQAIAAVRGTNWAVDAAGSKTSVFVDSGRVSVRRPDVDGRVVLGPGEGVDVEGMEPLNVKRWPTARVAALMARLGR